MKNIFHEEISKFILLSDKPEDFPFAFQLLKGSLVDDISIVDKDKLDRVLNLFFKMCGYAANLEGEIAILR